MNTIKSYNIFYNKFFFFSYDESVVIRFDLILILNELTPYNIVKNIIKSCFFFFFFEKKLNLVLVVEEFKK